MTINLIVLKIQFGRNLTHFTENGPVQSSWVAQLGVALPSFEFHPSAAWNVVSIEKKPGEAVTMDYLRFAA